MNKIETLKKLINQNQYRPSVRRVSLALYGKYAAELRTLEAIGDKPPRVLRRIEELRALKRALV